MQPQRKKGKRGRKLIRSIKRDRYSKSFEKRYGMTRGAWVRFKRENPSEVVHARRMNALNRIR